MAHSGAAAAVNMPLEAAIKSAYLMNAADSGECGCWTCTVTGAGYVLLGSTDLPRPDQSLHSYMQDFGMSKTWTSEKVSFRNCPVVRKFALHAALCIRR